MTDVHQRPSLSNSFEQLSLDDDGSSQDGQQNSNQANSSGQRSGTSSLSASQTVVNPEFAIKHPLQNSWTWWYDYPGKKTNQSTWANHLKKIYTFSSVEDFWSLFNNLKPASEIQTGSNYHVFKEGVEPKWEDEQNAKGGKWLITLPPKARVKQLDQMWLWALLACIGENFDDDSDQICGCVVSIRKPGDRIAIWTRDANNEAAQIRIGEKLKAAIGLPPSQEIGYQVHSDAMSRTSSRDNKNKYSI
eukprot:TRINITY_DN4099_c0_g1_i1.p1 TRINITY_DN4099_c0_g1~~TRINITY_DN4099_c0_g1_i1.p1  ORF type:complete len:247 (+),score=73.73 TRINITY_DN4099_c0_g1_i1:312-1052(+)